MEVTRLQAFDEAAVALIATLLGVRARPAPYRIHGQNVYQITLHNTAMDLDVSLILWPSLARADVRIGDCTMVFKEISGVELYPGVEVMFRRTNPPGHLFLSVSGRAEMAV